MKKYAWAGLAAIAALAALFFRSPGIGPAAPNPAAQTRPTDQGFGALEESPPRRVTRAPRTPLGRPIIVYVAGEVRMPGVYTLPSDSRAVDALGRAGGALADADLVAVNLAAPLADGDELAVPKIGEPAARSRSRSRSPHPRHSHRPRGDAHGGRRPDTQQAQAQSIDLNAATEAELQDVPGIGPGLAARIVAYRETNGPFSSVDELADVSGITPRLQDALADFVFVR